MTSHISSSNVTVGIIVVMATIATMVRAQVSTVTYTVVEERPPRTLLGNILSDSGVSVPPDSQGDLRFQFLTEGNNDADYLWINSTSGDLKTSTKIDREALCRRQSVCELNVQAVIQAQRGSFLQVVPVKVTITDINDNTPTFDPSKFTVRVSEDRAPGATFRLPTAVDLDGGDGNSVRIYRQVASTPFDAPFKLIVNGGSSPEQYGAMLRLDSALNREDTPLYEILIEAIDGGSPDPKTGTLTVVIEVEDVNDHSPEFERRVYTEDISEIAQVGDVVVTVVATDQDAGENGAVTYSAPVASQEDDVVLTLFSIVASTGEIKTLKPLDTYAGQTYRLNIVARDGGVNPQEDSAEVVINIVDTHNSHPEIVLNLFGEDGVAQVSESAPLDFVVALVDVSDPDSAFSPNGQVTCSLRSDHFELQPMSTVRYKVKLTKQLDRETDELHTLTVTCADSGTPMLNASESFTVKVKDENDNSPQFGQPFYTADITEGLAGSGAVIINLSATDKDDGVNAQISYMLDKDADSDFGIYADGSLVVTNPAGVDREDPVKGGTRDIVVLAIDGGSSPETGSTTVRVTIEDVNDNAPIFTEPVFYFRVPEDAPIGRLVDTISAVDPDFELNSIFYFRLAEDRDSFGNSQYGSNFPFEVNLGGNVTVSERLDRERQAEYVFQVLAYDLGQPMQLTSTVSVRVSVTDINDNSPYFTFPTDNNNTVHVPHTLSANTAFSKVTARDPDKDRNAAVVYAREGGNGSAFFDVDVNSGQVVLTRALTENHLGLYVLSLSAHDKGEGTQHATQTLLYVVVYEGNATLASKTGSDDGGIGFRNVIVVVVLLVVTVVLSLAILLTIILIRRVDRQRRRYHAKGAEMKADSNMHRLNITTSSTLTAGLQSSSSSTHSSASSTSSSPSPNLPGDMGGGNSSSSSKKKKEVSFSLDDENNVGDSRDKTGPTFTSFSPVISASSEKYDAIPESDRGKIKPELFSSNHYQSSERNNKSSGLKKDIHSLNFHQIHPAHNLQPLPLSSTSSTSSSTAANTNSNNAGSGNSKNANNNNNSAVRQVVHHHDDNLSDVSGDMSTSDSGRGGSDVELHSHGGLSKESGDTSFASQRGYNPHNNLNMTLSNGSNSKTGGINNSNHNSSKPSSGSKSVHFQNIHPDPVGVGSFLPPPTSQSNVPARPPRPRHAPTSASHRPQASTTSSNPSRYTPNLFSEDNGSYVKLANHDGRLLSSPSPIPLNKSRKLQPAVQMDTFSSNQSNRFAPSHAHLRPGEVEYMDMTGGRSSFTSQGSNLSNSGLDGTGTWDGDTTTSGSYTVDAHELCDEIDKLFFDEIQDVVV
ncbi:protocadherin-11 x-linked [Plakobranchus ocellatus]|uniref:Protocadherin-11 x-linked n=1 Tax=Plakobranchus ocellatus TaxID=259542 RepID=A0AAV3XYH9_9GAST|nr:protocadherin-11 x-linked [Plakobranchus ocellatus]